MSKILLIDDDDTILTALNFSLEGFGYDVKVATDGKEGIKMYSEFMPDLVITDLMMPFTSGLEVIKYIRETMHDSTPIIMFSGEGHDDILNTAFDLGATDYLVKPIKPSELIKRINKVLKNTD